MFDNLFNMDNAFWRTMTLVADLLLVNVLFIVCSLPIITIGASATALYTVTLKQVKRQEGYITTTFFKAFKENFKQSTVIWLIMLVGGALLGLDIYLFKTTEMPGEKIIHYLVAFVCLTYVITLCYVFPLQSKFVNSVKQTMKNALLLSIANFFPRTILIVILHALPIVFLLINPVMMAYVMPVMIFGGFALIAYLSSMIFVKIFARYMPEEETDTFDIDSDEYSIEDAKTEETTELIEEKDNTEM